MSTQKTLCDENWLSTNLANSDTMVQLINQKDKKETKHALKEWEAGLAFDWEDSKLTYGLRHTIIDIDDDISLSVEVGGNPNNPPLMLIMGLGSQMVFWPDNFIYRLIASGFFVIRFDNRDIGLSTKVKRISETKVNRLKMMLRMHVGMSNSHIPVSYTLKDMAQDTKQLIQKLGLKQVNVMGASMGGIIAQLLAQSDPHLIKNLVLLFTTTNRALLPPPRPKQLHTLFKAPASQDKSDIISHGVWFIKTVGSPGFLNLDKITRTAQIRYERNYHPLGTIQQLNAILATGSISQYSKKIKAPTLVLSGDKDGLVPASHGRDVAKTIPNSDFHLIEGMGHDLSDYYQPFIVDKIVTHCLY